MSLESNPRVTTELVTVRAIRMDDLEMEREFIRRLSPAARRYRFLGGVNELPLRELRRLCVVDGENSMAFIATIQRDGREVEIGVARYSPGTGSDTREMAVTVSDEWQHQGLGTALVKRLIETAKLHGVTRLYSLDLAENGAMAALARDLGMASMRDPSDPHQVIYSLKLHSVEPTVTGEVPESHVSSGSLAPSGCEKRTK